jgi:hypothetical protein
MARQGFNDETRNRREKMAALFTAKSPDGRAMWRIVYDHVTGTMQPGDTINFTQLATLLDVADKHRIYPVIAKANHELWAKAQRSLSVVRGVGYRVLKADEHEIQALGYQTQARRRMSNAVSVMRATDLVSLPPAKRDWALKVTAGLIAVGRALDAHSERLAQHDGLIKDLAKRVTDLEKEENDT